MHYFVLLSALATFTLANPCSSGWKYFSGTNSCYKVLRDELPWTVAEFRCLFQGAHHTSITSREENQFINELSQYREIWLGAAYFGNNPVYVNSDQKPFGGYEQWKAGSRPSMKRSRRCIKMNGRGSWFQSCCKKRTYSICKKAAPYGAKTNNFRRTRSSRY